jgi:hypothetical protein
MTFVDRILSADADKAGHDTRALGGRRHLGICIHVFQQGGRP